eukprot:SAG11_NODE_3888_length_2165_cov_1.057599_4_plen_56_part_00
MPPCCVNIRRQDGIEFSYLPVGCTNRQAFNFDSQAVLDDGKVLHDPRQDLRVRGS